MKINDFKIFSINSTHVMKYHSWFIKCTKSLNNESCTALGCLCSGWDFSCKTLPEMSQLDDYSCVTQGSFPTDSTALLPPPSPRWLNTLHFLKQLLEDIGRIYLAREREGGKGQSLSNTWLVSSLVCSVLFEDRRLIWLLFCYWINQLQILAMKIQKYFQCFLMRIIFLITLSDLAVLLPNK